MENIYHTISGSEFFSLLDGLLGYNQVLGSELDSLKSTFGTKWGTFTYRYMPFGLVNVGGTFKFTMDITLR